MYYNEKDIEGQKLSLNNDERVMYVKLVGIGPKTLTANENVVSGIPSQTGGWFITGDKKTLREALHKLLDIACDAQEKAHGEGN